ncbi:hypothetical protein [Marinicrinis lubricantis]|uniref:STAS domain-containing protein n=1 Tax=Marinicrinis lubricantis TaxID=2086470 RepID=A0ABW1IS29_9BACL
MAKGSFRIELNMVDRVMEMQIGGTFTAEDYARFIAEYEKKTASLDGPSYTLRVDCKAMDLLSAQEVESLKGSFEKYKQTGFREVVFIITEAQLFMKMQLKRVARSAGLDNVEVVTEGA